MSLLLIGLVDVFLGYLPAALRLQANALKVLFGMVRDTVTDPLPVQFKEQLAAMLLDRLADENLTLRHMVRPLQPCMHDPPTG